MNDIQQSIQSFAKRILQYGMAADFLEHQRQSWGEDIVNPLPIDIASASSPSLNIQLIKTVRNAVHRFEELHQPGGNIYLYIAPGASRELLNTTSSITG